MKYVAHIPLIGGFALANMNVVKKPPIAITSYSAFGNNDKLFLRYLQKKNIRIPYFELDKLNEGQKKSIQELIGKIDFVSGVPPCSGLSMSGNLKAGERATAPANDWMYLSAEFVLGTMKPKVFWGENAPTFAGKTGAKIRQKIYEIGRKNGYTMSIYKTKSLDHGLPQYRGRCFYFFWKEKNSVPLFSRYQRDFITIEDLIDGVQGNSQRELTNKAIPSENMYYRYLLDVAMPGATHEEYVKTIEYSSDVLTYILKHGTSFPKLAEYFKKLGNEAEYNRCLKRQSKLDNGKGNMLRTIYLPKKRTGAFVGYLPTHMTHHREDRFLSYRECMAIMGLPQDFELLNPRKNLNHICQNVPVTTAKDMAGEIKKYLEGNAKMVDATQFFQANDNSGREQIWEKEEPTLERHFG